MIELYWWQFLVLTSFAICCGYFTAIFCVTRGRDEYASSLEEGIFMRDIEIKELKERAEKWILKW